MRRLLFLFLVFLLLMASCSRGGKELVARLHLADSLMEAEPDSGLALLMSLQEEAEGASKANRYLYHLLLAKAKNQTYVPITTDSILREVADYYDDHGSANQRMMTHYLLGCAYRDKGDLPQALLRYEEAISQADTASQDCDFKTLGRIYGQAGEILCEFGLPRDLLEYARQSQRFARKAKDTAMYISAYERMATAYEMLCIPDSEIIVSEAASMMYVAYEDRQGAAMALCPLIDNYVDRKDWAHAKRCINLYEKESGVFLPNGNIEPGREIYYYLKGLYYIGISQVDSANYYFRKLFDKRHSSLNEKTAAAKGLFKLYKKTGDKDSALKYSELMTNLTAKSLLLQKERGTSRVNALYKHNKAQERSRQKELEATITRYGFYLLIAVLVVIASAFSLINNKKNRKLHEKQLEIDYTKKMLAQAKQDLTMLQAQDNENAAKLIEQKQEQINSLQAKIDKLSKPRDKAEVESKLLNAPITYRFRTLADNSMERPSMQDWHALREMMERENPAFPATLNQREPLQQDEYDICVLIRLRFRPTEVAKLLGISKANVTTKRGRMLKKITGKEGSAKDLDHFLWEIY